MLRRHHFFETLAALGLALLVASAAAAPQPGSVHLGDDDGRADRAGLVFAQPAARLQPSAPRTALAPGPLSLATPLWVALALAAVLARAPSVVLSSWRRRKSRRIRRFHIPRLGDDLLTP